MHRGEGKRVRFSIVPGCGLFFLHLDMKSVRELLRVPLFHQLFLSLSLLLRLVILPVKLVVSFCLAEQAEHVPRGPVVDMDP